MWPYPKWIAHRGAGLQAPENTLAAMRVGAGQGLRMMEYDVQLSRDGVPILLHDTTLERTSNGQGQAADLTLAELARFDFGAWHGPQYAGEPIATLHAVAAYTLANGLCSNIEIKPHPRLEHETGALVARAAARLWAEAPQPPLLSSFSIRALQAARDTAPHLPRAMLVDALPPDWPARMHELGCTVLNIDYHLVTPELVRIVHEYGWHITAWTVNDAASARELLAWGCDALFTDAIDQLPAIVG